MSVTLPAFFLLLETLVYQALWVLPPVRHPEVLLRAFGDFKNSSFSGGFSDSASQAWRLALFICINCIPVIVAPFHFMLLNAHVPAWSKQPIAIGLALAGVVTVTLAVEIIPRALSMYPLFGLALPSAVATNLVVQAFQFTHVLSSKYFHRLPQDHAAEFAAREATAAALMREGELPGAGGCKACCRHGSTEVECNWNICACITCSRCSCLRAADAGATAGKRCSASPSVQGDDSDAADEAIGTDAMERGLSAAPHLTAVFQPLAVGAGLSGHFEGASLASTETFEQAPDTRAGHSMAGIELPGLSNALPVSLVHREQGGGIDVESRSAGGAPPATATGPLDLLWPPQPSDSQANFTPSGLHSRNGSVVSFTSSALSEVTCTREGLPQHAGSVPGTHRRASAADVAPPAAQRHARGRSFNSLPRTALAAPSLQAPFPASDERETSSSERLAPARTAWGGKMHHDHEPRAGDVKEHSDEPRSTRYASAPTLHVAAGRGSTDTWAALRPAAQLSAVAGIAPSARSNADDMARRPSLLGWHPRKLSVDSVDAAHSRAWEGSMRRRQWWSIAHTVLAVVFAFGSALMFRTSFANASTPIMQVLLNVFIVSALAFLRFVVLHTAKWARSGAGERCSCLRSMLPLTSERCLQCMFELNLRLTGTEEQGGGSAYTAAQPDPRFVWRGYHIVEVALAGAERRLASPLARVKLQRPHASHPLYTLQPLPGSAFHGAAESKMPGVRAVLPGDGGDFIDDAQPYAGRQASAQNSVDLPPAGAGVFSDMRAHQLVPPIKLPTAQAPTTVRLHAAPSQALQPGALQPKPHTPQQLGSLELSSSVSDVRIGQPAAPASRLPPSTAQEAHWDPPVAAPASGISPSMASRVSFDVASDAGSAKSADDASEDSWSAPPSEGSDPFQRDADRRPPRARSAVSFASSGWYEAGDAGADKAPPAPLPHLLLSSPAPLQPAQALGAPGQLPNAPPPPSHQDEEHRSVSGVAQHIAEHEAALFHALPVIHLNLWSNESQDRLLSMFITMILELFTAFALTDIVSPTVFAVLLTWQSARALAAHGVRFILSSEHQQWAVQRFASRLPVIGAWLGWMLDRIAVDRVSNLDVRIAYYKLLLQTYILQPDAHSDLVRAMACVADVPVRLTRRGSLASDLSGTMGSSVAGIASSAPSAAELSWGGGSAAGGDTLPVLRVPALSRTADAQIRQMMVLRSAQNSMMHMGAAIAANIFFAVALALDRLPRWSFRIRLTAFVEGVQVQRGALYGAVQLPVLAIAYVCCCWLMHYYRGINASAVWVSLYTHRRTAVVVAAMVLLLGQYANSFYFSPPDA